MTAFRSQEWRLCRSVMSWGSSHSTTINIFLIMHFLKLTLVQGKLMNFLPTPTHPWVILRCTGRGINFLIVTWKLSLWNLSNLCKTFSFQIRLVPGHCLYPIIREWHEDTKNLLRFCQPNILSFSPKYVTPGSWGWASLQGWVNRVNRETDWNRSEISPASAICLALDQKHDIQSYASTLQTQWSLHTRIPKHR